MSVPARLGAFAGILVVSFVLGAALGRAVPEVGGTPEPSPTTVVGVAPHGAAHDPAAGGQP